LQWETKVKGVGHALRRAGIAEQQNWEEIPADQIWGYRNRVQLRGRAEQLGFFKRLSQELVAINHCAIARPEINEALEETHLEAKRLGMSRPGAAGSAHYKVELEVLANGQLRRTWNAKHSENGFRQVHDAQNLKLQEWIDQQAPDSPVLYDLYGGSGNLSLRLAKKMQEIHCVDLAAPIDRPVGTPDHFHFHRKAVLPWLMKAAHAQTLPGDFQSGGQPGGTAILDPSREGLGGDWQEIAQCLQRFKVSHLFQVGCDPDSWARDVSRWIKGGWIPRKWMVIDLFPQTAHVECVAFLTRQ
jgi:tRNA/tmRNA/rRNA uracil-C5-methylase (TrmA/RlmC/RlmD family)